MENRYFILDTKKQNILKTFVKNQLRQLKVFCYTFLSNCYHAKITEKKYKVSICAIFKNEAPYLKEWLEFNHLVGIEHFYMYNNNSEDDYLSVLKPYIDSGLVTLIQWPFNQQQMQCYKDCIFKYSSDTKWLGFIDIDEFIVPKSTDNIYDFLKKFEKKYGAVNIYWKLFGTSGLIERDKNGLVTEDFTVCWPKYCDIGKCFFNTAFKFDGKTLKNNILHHICWTKICVFNVPPVNVFGKFSFNGRHIAKSYNFPVQINHYFTKSLSEYAEKRAKGDVYFRDNPHNLDYFYEHEMKCTSVDFSAYKYLVKLKLLLK